MVDSWSDKDTDWNFALAYLKRIDILLQQCNFYKGRNDFDNWLLSAYSVHDELYPRMIVEKKRDGTIVCDEPIEANKLFEKAKASVRMNIKGNVDRWIIINNLSNYERFLRDILRKRGMDMPKKNDPGRSLLEN